MLFTSMEFLLFFLPVLGWGIHFILPKAFRNYWLLIVSLLFYAWGEPEFVIVMLLSILCNYLLALRIEEINDNKYMQKVFLALSVIVNLGLLFVFKYLNFITKTLLDIYPGLTEYISQTNIALPIGISFFTFQAMSYVVDVYRGMPAQKNLCYLAMYIAFFPQLIAGPIVRYKTVMDQINHRIISVKGFGEGILRFLYGFNKKVLLSNILAEVADFAFDSSDLSVAMAWLGAISYTLQIFFDFSGYSEMAIGLGKMYGFDFLENFNYPYISKTVTEFWRRWHISLGSWFRDYVYFPLGGSRVNSKSRLIFNLSVVWLATGVWHGASWNFVVWGIIHGTIVIIEKIFDIPNKLQNKKGIAYIYQMFVVIEVVCGWVLFRTENLTAGLEYIKSMWTIKNNVFFDDIFIFYLREYALFFIVGVICSTPVFRTLKKRIACNTHGIIIYNNMECLIQIILFVVSISYLVMNAHNPFIYFNF